MFSYEKTTIREEKNKTEVWAENHALIADEPIEVGSRI